MTWQYAYVYLPIITFAATGDRYSAFNNSPYQAYERTEEAL